MRHRPLTALLLATVLAAPQPAQVTRPAPAARAQAPGNGTTVVIWARHIQALQARLDSFAVALPAEERALWNGVLVRAANAPTPAAAEVRVTPVLEIGPGGGCEDSPGMDGAANRVAIIVQGGRAAGAEAIVVQGGRVPGQVNGAAAPGVRPAAPGDVRRPTDAAPIDAKLEPVPWLATASLGRRLAELSSRLPAEERGVLNWLLTRAAAGLPGEVANIVVSGRGNYVHAVDAAGSQGRPVTADSLAQGAQGLDGFWWPPLPKALGIDPRPIGPRRDDPAPPPPAGRWIIRY
jgi:hypothetical protein